MGNVHIGSTIGFGQAQSSRRSRGWWPKALVALLLATVGSLGSHASTAVTKTFRQGDANGSTVTDGGVTNATPNTNYATAGYIAVNVSTGGHALIRFENVFGNGPNQIPDGSTITSATVDLYLSGVASGAAAMHRILVPWQDTATYNSMTTSGAGIQHDNVESAAVADAYSNVSIGST